MAWNKANTWLNKFNLTVSIYTSIQPKSREKNTQLIKLSSLCLYYSREPPILLFNAKLIQLLLILLVNVLWIQPLHSFLSINFDTTCQDQNHQLPLCTKFKKGLLNGKTKSSSSKPMLTTSKNLVGLYQSLGLQIKQAPCHLDFHLPHPSFNQDRSLWILT